MKLTQEQIEQAKSDNGQFGKEQLALLNIHYPLPSGWKQQMIDGDYNPDVIEQFISLKNAHLTIMSDKRLVDVARKYLFNNGIPPTQAFRDECPFDLPDDEFYRTGNTINDGDDVIAFLWQENGYSINA